MKINKNYGIIAACLATFVLIGLVEKNHEDKPILHIDIDIEQQYDNFFVDKADIRQLIASDQSNLIGISMGKVELKSIEDKIKANKFVKETDVYKDLKGSLIINVKQRRPIARFIRESGPDAYIGESGLILPVSDRFTARVVLISGDAVDKIVKRGNINEMGGNLLAFLKEIDRDPFWKAQIAQIDIQKDNELLLYPQIGKQVIEFGTPDDYEIKLRKLKVFFKKVLPQKGWNHYNRVNIKYKNQIVCE